MNESSPEIAHEDSTKVGRGSKMAEEDHSPACSLEVIFGRKDVIGEIGWMARHGEDSIK